ncbi:YncE family protein [Brevibacillus borstelensis]|uniref:YncE family protein n=1 Tax=Brevibacillus borstelensis TaxID=45462 RepID=UPI000F0735C9|nr:hypothetical protein [Brevibacillus borstelensis]MED1883106.1 hypothetical protein [Brevibacillus borstelensis]RNB65204.1 hypothetical protein EDM54_04655 [Brevibacillus borstelensis]GED53203.1 hypothetical protein BBO01nite_24440 [Brevibacillus borstelensis]
MKKYMLFLLVSILFIAGCQNTDEMPLQNKTPHLAVIKQAGKSNVVTLDKDYKVVKEKKIGKFLIDAQIDGQTLYLIDPGIEEPRKDLYAVNLYDLSYETLTLPYIPQKLFIHDRIAYIASSVESRNVGFHFMLVDLDTFSLIETLTVPGAVRSMIPAENGITMYVNSGGAHNYGQYAKKVQIGKAETGKYQIITMNDIPEELPPNGVVPFQDHYIAVYAGFAKGPKPKWVKRLESYTSKMKVLNPKTGSVLQEITLEETFPQSIVRKGDIAFVNHFTDLDMTGDTISVYDLKKMELKAKLQSPTPSSIALDGSNLLVSNMTQGTLSVFDTEELKQKQQVAVGEWPSKVLVVPERNKQSSLSLK